MSVSTGEQKIHELLTRGVEEVIVYEDLQKKLQSGRQLRVKFGIDPTGADLHIGHAVPLRKLRQFQDMGHQAILLIGDYTARIGDPSGRDKTRPMITKEDVEKNMQTYIEQAQKILDIDAVEIRYNSEWYEGQGLQFMMELTGKITVPRVLDRDDFKKRLDEGVDIQMQEILYPLLQGYDSVALKADVEIGGTDQKFNLLMGRKVQKRYDQPEQDILTTPLLVGTDGEKKMSKTYGNYIALKDTPEGMFGKVMSIPDALMLRYFELCTSVPMQEVAAMREEMNGGANPRDYKLRLAYEITKTFLGGDAAEKGKAHFATVIQGHEAPQEMPELAPSVYDVLTLLVEAGFVQSRNEARRAIEQGGVKINDVKVSDADAVVAPGDVVQKGKRFFVRII